MDVHRLLAEGRGTLAGTDAPELEAAILLGYVLGRDRAWFYAHPEAVVAGADTARYRALLERRRDGEPIAYLTGVREFWSLDLRVTPDVLIPRPETELLVETALARIPPDADWRIADLGTGSGAVALAIAAERPGCEVHATELSDAALAVARANAGRLLPGRIRFHAGSWCEPLRGAFRLIASNPPYVSTGELATMAAEVKDHEPREALVAGPRGTEVIEALIPQAAERLVSGGYLLVEINPNLHDAIRRLITADGRFELGPTVHDLARLPRVVQAKKL